MSEKNAERLTLAIIFMMFLAVLFFGSSYNKPKTDDKPEQEPKIEEKNDPKPATSSTTSTGNDKDPYRLSFHDSSYFLASELKNKLSTSELEYCSYVIEDSDYADLILTWNLKSNNAEVYRCTYKYNKDREYKMRSSVSCSVSDAYQEYLDGDKALIRDYVMPEKDDHIDIFVYDDRSSYYDEYFILGRYSDMECYVKGDEIYFTYYWYQKTNDGPKLVYKSTATNYKTTWGQRYDDELWESFEESYKNINIIPYDDFPRDHDYFDEYYKWKDDMRRKEKQEDLEEMIDEYCDISDPEDLFYEYEDVFEYYEDAEEFFDKYCR